MSDEDTAKLEQSVKVVARAWASSPYYARAENFTHLFWGEKTIFRRTFDQLDLANVVELSCGHGRHAEQSAPLCQQLTVVDIFDENLEITRQRLLGSSNVAFLRNNGYDFQPLQSGVYTAIYCYDSMVHFSADLVAAYLKDGARILAAGGRMALHHSNHDAPDTKHYGANPGARNHMTFPLFESLARAAGLTVKHSRELRWAGVDALDRVTLLEKPGAKAE